MSIVTPTVWFLVQLFAVGDTWALRPGHMPEEFATLTQCNQAGLDLMIDRRNEKIKLHCIEADDEHDLQKIMLHHFKFRGDSA